MPAGRAAWVVPPPLRGSGGHRTIYQSIGALAAAGYDCHVYVEDQASGSATRLRTLAEDYFGPIPATFHCGTAQLGADLRGPHDVVFATAWSTADAVRRVSEPCIKVYFVQDLEASFLPMSDAHLMAQNTLRYGFEGITIGRWLTRKLGEDFGMRAQHFDFCADRSVYRPLHQSSERSVCFVYQPEKPRRCSAIGSQALAIVERELPGTQIYFFGSDRPPDLPYPHQHLGLLPIKACNELYNRCAVGLCVSSTNPSRIPFEMMAAGLPVVDIWADNTVYDLPDAGVRLAEPTPESLAFALLELLRDEEQRVAMSKAGSAFMQERDLAHGFDQFVHATDALREPARTRKHARPERTYALDPVTAPDHVAARFRSHLDELGPLAPPANRASIPRRVGRRLVQTLRVLFAGP